MRFYRDAGAGEQQVRDWIQGWTHRRTLREVRHFLITAYLMADESCAASDLVDRLIDGGTHAGLIDRMTEAIAFVTAHPEIERWATDLMVPHEELAWMVDGEDDDAGA